MPAIPLNDLFTIDRLELLFSGQTNWNTVLSSNMTSLNMVLPFLKRVVESITVSVPPAITPGECPAYLVPLGAVGEWATHDREFAVYSPAGEEWLFFTPFEGYIFYCKEDKRAYVLVPGDQGLGPVAL